MHEESLAITADYRAAQTLMRGHGEPVKVRVGGHRQLRARLTGRLTAQGVKVVEVIRPNRQAHRTPVALNSRLPRRPEHAGMAPTPGTAGQSITGT